jgi:hypothetical protein
MRGEHTCLTLRLHTVCLRSLENVHQQHSPCPASTPSPRRVPNFEYATKSHTSTPSCMSTVACEIIMPMHSMPLNCRRSILQGSRAALRDYCDSTQPPHPDQGDVYLTYRDNDDFERMRRDLAPMLFSVSGGVSGVGKGLLTFE